MGRPKRTEEPVIHQVKYVLYPGIHDDLIRFFAQIPPRKKAQASIAAMRSGQMLSTVESSDIDDDEIDAALDDFIL